MLRKLFTISSKVFSWSGIEHTKHQLQKESKSTENSVARRAPIEQILVMVQKRNIGNLPDNFFLLGIIC